MTSIDLHIDIPWQCHTQQRALQLDSGVKTVQVDFPRMKEGGLDSFVAPLFVPDTEQNTLGVERSWNAIKTQYHWLKQWQGKQILLALKGGRLIDSSELRIGELAEMGIKYFGLVHNSNSPWADSATDKLTHNGLSSVGKRLVRVVQTRRIIVDVSHASDQTALDVIGLTPANTPVIASHSWVRNLVDHPRNLSNFLIKEIAETGGIIGVPYNSKLVGDRDGVTLAIDHIAQLLGTTANIGIGSGLDGANTVIPDVSEWSDVLEPLLDLGYTEDDLAGIKGENFRRLINAA